MSSEEKPITLGDTVLTLRKLLTEKMKTANSFPVLTPIISTSEGNICKPVSGTANFSVKIPKISLMNVRISAAANVNSCSAALKKPSVSDQSKTLRFLRFYVCKRLERVVY